ncbi:hypothetical protein L611_000900000030 [Aminobacter sp. J15]|nr:hypothetical protein L611_000900000030 [Aminobacter sp. J15]
MTNKVHIIRWVSDPVCALPGEPLSCTVCNWQHQPGEDWSAGLSARYHELPEISIELCIGRAEVAGVSGYVAIVSGRDLRPFRHLFATLHSAMLAAETMASQLICERQRELTSQEQRNG